MSAEPSLDECSESRSRRVGKQRRGLLGPLTQEDLAVFSSAEARDEEKEYKGWSKIHSLTFVEIFLIIGSPV